MDDRMIDKATGNRTAKKKMDEKIYSSTELSDFTEINKIWAWCARWWGRDDSMIDKIIAEREENNINSNQVDHRTAKKKMDEKTMVEGIEKELTQALGKGSNKRPCNVRTAVNILLALIESKIEFALVQSKAMNGIDVGPGWGVKQSDGEDSIAESIYDSTDLIDLPAFLPLTDLTPEQFATIRNGDRFNVDGQTMHVRYEKNYIPGLRSLQVVKGND